MGDALSIEIEVREDRFAYRRIFIIAIVVAAVSVVPLMLVKDSAPWAILIPIGIGGVIISFFEARDLLRAKDQKEQIGHIVDRISGDLIPPEPVHFPSNFWLQLKKVKKQIPGQLDLFEFMVDEGSDRRRVQIVPTAKGDIYVIGAERFQEVLLDRSTPEIDKATEHALAVAFQRYGSQLGEEAKDLLRRQFREAIKDDLRGNLTQLFALKGAQVINDLLKSTEAPEQSPKIPRVIKKTPLGI